MTFKYTKKQLPGGLTFVKRTGRPSSIDLFDMGFLKHPESPEEFVRGLIVFYESDNDFKIKPVGENPITIPFDLFGCRTNDTKEWEALIDSLKNKGIFNIENEARRKILMRLNKKFVNLFNTRLSAFVPSNYKTYERSEGKKYKFKFTVVEKGFDKFYLYCDELSKEELEQLIKDIAKKMFGKPNLKRDDLIKFQTAYGIYKKKGWDPDGSFQKGVFEAYGPQVEIGEEIVDPYDGSMQIKNSRY